MISMSGEQQKYMSENMKCKVVAPDAISSTFFSRSRTKSACDERGSVGAFVPAMEHPDCDMPSQRSSGIAGMKLVLSQEPSHYPPMGWRSVKAYLA